MGAKTRRNYPTGGWCGETECTNRDKLCSYCLRKELLATDIRCIGGGLDGSGHEGCGHVGGQSGDLCPECGGHATIGRVKAQVRPV